MAKKIPYDSDFLYDAAQSGSLQRVTGVLQEYSRHIEPFQITFAFKLAIMGGHFPLVEALIPSVEDLDDELGEALRIAANKGNDEIALFLIQQGANLASALRGCERFPSNNAAAQEWIQQYQVRQVEREQLQREVGPTLDRTVRQRL